jgi:hypothetical protein
VSPGLGHAARITVNSLHCSGPVDRRARTVRGSAAVFERAGVVVVPDRAAPFDALVGGRLAHRTGEIREVSAVGRPRAAFHLDERSSRLRRRPQSGSSRTPTTTSPRPEPPRSPSPHGCGSFFLPLVDPAGCGGTADWPIRRRPSHRSHSPSGRAASAWRDALGAHRPREPWTGVTGPRPARAAQHRRPAHPPTHRPV